MSETEHYRSQGYVHLEKLFPEEVLLAFYRRMERDLKAAGMSDTMRHDGSFADAPSLR